MFILNHYLLNTLIVATKRVIIVKKFKLLEEVARKSTKTRKA